MFSTASLSISIDDHEIVAPLSLDFAMGQVTAILGHNGSGKSSLAFALMGHPRYQTTGAIMLHPIYDMRRGFFSHSRTYRR